MDSTQINLVYVPLVQNRTLLTNHIYENVTSIPRSGSPNGTVAAFNPGNGDFAIVTGGAVSVYNTRQDKIIIQNSPLTGAPKGFFDLFYRVDNKLIAVTTTGGSLKLLEITVAPLGSSMNLISSIPIPAGLVLVRGFYKNTSDQYFAFTSGTDAVQVEMRNRTSTKLQGPKNLKNIFASTKRGLLFGESEGYVVVVRSDFSWWNLTESLPAPHSDQNQLVVLDNGWQTLYLKGGDDQWLHYTFQIPAPSAGPAQRSVIAGQRKLGLLGLFLCPS